jgi:hypothetical protein
LPDTKEQVKRPRHVLQCLKFAKKYHHGSANMVAKKDKKKKNQELNLHHS